MTYEQFVSRTLTKLDRMIQSLENPAEVASLAQQGANLLTCLTQGGSSWQQLSGRDFPRDSVCRDELLDDIKKLGEREFVEKYDKYYGAMARHVYQNFRRLRDENNSPTTSGL